MDRRVAAAVLGNRMLARVEVAYGAFNLADWIRWIAIVVYAFDRGGAAEAGVISLVQSLAAASVAPFAATMGDRWSRSGMLLVGYLARAGASARAPRRASRSTAGGRRAARPAPGGRSAPRCPRRLQRTRPPAPAPWRGGRGCGPPGR